MLLQQHLIELFANLPYLPKLELIKHFDNCQLTKLAIISKNWQEAVKFQLRKRENAMEIQLKTLENSAKIEICFGQWREEKVVLSIIFFVNSKRNHVELRDPEFIEIHSKDAKTRESEILSIIDFFRCIFQLKIHTIHLNFDHGYSLKFFEFLDLKSLPFLVLESEKARINGAELAKILEKVEVRGFRTLKMKSIRSFKGGEYLLDDTLYLEDSRWMTGKMLVERVKSFGTFGKCRFTDKEYNRYLRKIREDEKCVKSIEFHSEHTLDIDKVIRGLDAKPWDPAVRSRKKDFDMSEPLRIVDLADGWDFVTKSGELITVHLSQNRKILQVHWWKNRKYPLLKLRKLLKSSRKILIRWLGRHDISRRARECYEKDIIKLNAEIQLIDQERS